MAEKSRKLTRRKLLLLGGAALGSGAAATWIAGERDRLQLKRLRVDGPVDARIGFLTDFHANEPNQIERAVRAVEMVGEDSPDILLLGGDYVDEDNDRLDACFEPVASAIRSLAVPTFAVLGNHDMASGKPERTQKHLERHAIQLLRDEQVRSNGLTIYGLDEGFYGKKTEGAEDLAAKADVAIWHEPDLFDRLPSPSGLLLGGHSHGGQACWPGGTPISLPFGARKYYSGSYALGAATIYVSHGVGTSHLDRRMFSPPDVTIVEMTRSSA